MWLRKLLPLALAVALIAATAHAQDHCGQYPTCQQCVTAPLCGWCSTNTTSPGPNGRNVTGPQCAGFNPDGKTPFACDGIYSTETCVSGYECDLATFTCRQGAPGTGTTLDKCQRNCTNQGQVFLCNQTTQKCYQVPQGTPDASSLIVCEAACAHPTAHPSSPNPAPPQELYACNYTTGECEAAEPGKGTSKEVCLQSCHKSNGTQYTCNTALKKCIPLPPTIPGQSLQQCEQQCNPQPQPNPPPNFPVGLWRGIQIDNQYQIGEYDLFVNETTVFFISMIRGNAPVTIVGKPFHIPSTTNQPMLYIQITEGAHQGEFMKTLADTSGSPGPQTTFMTMAVSAPGGDAPATIEGSFNNAQFGVFAFAKCNAAQCVFSLPDSSSDSMEGGSRRLRAVRQAVVDRCSQYYQNCSYCLSHPWCGWCSSDVTYSNGQKGTQCAGFNSPNNNESAAFVCAGRYSTLDCDVGYTCDTNTFQCVQAAPGNGVTKAQCETLCRPTPPPTPPVEQFVCNVSLKQCLPCNDTHCPGSMPQGPCEAACIHPKPGPDSSLVGVWRGIRIQNGYTTGEVEMVFTATNMSFYVEGAYQYIANVTSLGADLMLMEILDSDFKGATYGAIYQISNEYKNIYAEVTMAQGVFGQSAPSSYESAMLGQGATVYTMAQCRGEPCKFSKP